MKNLTVRIYNLDGIQREYFDVEKVHIVSLGDLVNNDIFKFEKEMYCLPIDTLYIVIMTQNTYIAFPFLENAVEILY